MRRTLALIGLCTLVATTLAFGEPAGAATASLSLSARWANTYNRFYADGTHETFSGAAVGDVTGDGAPDIIVGAPDGYLYGYRTDGTRFLTFDTTGGKGGAIQSTPTLADFTGDGILDILTSNTAGTIEVVTGNGGVPFWVHDNCGMPRCGVFGTPTAADIDRDGELEIIATSWDHHVYAWNLDRTLVRGFPVFVYDTIWSSPAVGDIDNDGYLEIVFGGDMAEYPGAPYPRGGLVFAVRHDGSRQPGFPRSLPGQTIWSSPALHDLNGDGSLDIVVGTGLNYNDARSAAGGHKVYALDKSGRDLPGWPASVGGNVMASPAVGDVDNDGQPEVAVMADDGRIYVINHNGSHLWSGCNVNRGSSCRAGYGVHGSVSIADVDNDGTQDIVGAGESWMRVINGSDGTIEAESPVVDMWAPGSPPTIASVNNRTWIIQNATINTNKADGMAGVGDEHVVLVWTTGTPLGRADWPTFKQNGRRTGTSLDDQAPAMTLPAPAGTQSTTGFNVSWSATDSGTGVHSFDIDVRYSAGGPWVRWLDATRPSSVSGSTANGVDRLFAQQGQTVGIRARARDRAGNVSAWSPVVSTTISSTATISQPFSSAYAVAGSGDLDALSSPAAAGSMWPGRDIVRGVASTADGGYFVDAYGGIHAFGTAPPKATSIYRAGWDIVRGIAVNRDGQGGYVLDGWGGLHPYGNAAPVATPVYWQGWDIARAVILTSSSTGARPSGYVLDGFGGLHPFGAAPRLATTGYWNGWDIAQAAALNPDGQGGYVLDGWGGLHRFGNAAPQSSPTYWVGWRIARGLATVGTGPSPAGYVVDGFGGIHRFGSAPALSTTRYWNADVIRGVNIRPW